MATSGYWVFRKRRISLAETDVLPLKCSKSGFSMVMAIGLNIPNFGKYMFFCRSFDSGKV